MRVSFTGLLRARLKEIHNVNANVGMVRLGIAGKVGKMECYEQEREGATAGDCGGGGHAQAVSDAG